MPARPVGPNAGGAVRPPAITLSLRRPSDGDGLAALRDRGLLLPTHLEVVLCGQEQVGGLEVPAHRRASCAGEAGVQLPMQVRRKRGFRGGKRPSPARRFSDLWMMGVVQLCRKQTARERSIIQRNASFIGGRPLAPLNRSSSEPPSINSLKMRRGSFPTVHAPRKSTRFGCLRWEMIEISLTMS